MTPMTHTGNAGTNTSEPVTPEVRAYAAVTGIVLLLLMLFGVLMRMTQGQWLGIGPNIFYQIMTAHGIGMVAIVTLGGMGVIWHFMGRHLKLHRAAAIANLILFLIGVVLVLVSIFIGGYAAAWTMLYPLSSNAMGLWSDLAATGYLVGVLVVGVGMLIFYLEIARAIVTQYEGGFKAALGWKRLRTGNKEDAPPPSIIAGAVCTIGNIVGTLFGAVILVMMLIHVFLPQFDFSALLAKNFIFIFGHVVINVAIYMAVVAVYEILPRYTGRPWGVYPAFILAWNATLLMVLTVYPHHLLMDFAMPDWMAFWGQIISYTSALPVFAVTLVGTLANVHRSGMRWDLTSGLLVLSIFGWSAGVVPAVLDGTIAINQVMHNTQWVPGHFHTYLLLGVVPMLLAFMTWIGNQGKAGQFEGLSVGTFWLFSAAGLGFTMAFLFAGSAGVARRYAAHLAEWVGYDRVASVFGLLVLLAAAAIILPAIVRIATRGGTVAATAR